MRHERNDDSENLMTWDEVEAELERDLEWETCSCGAVAPCQVADGARPEGC